MGVTLETPPPPSAEPGFMQAVPGFLSILVPVTHLCRPSWSLGMHFPGYTHPTYLASGKHAILTLSSAVLCQAGERTAPWVPSLRVPAPALLPVLSVTLGECHHLSGPGCVHLQEEGVGEMVFKAPSSFNLKLLQRPYLSRGNYTAF